MPETPQLSEREVVDLAYDWLDWRWSSDHSNYTEGEVRAAIEHDYPGGWDTFAADPTPGVR